MKNSLIVAFIFLFQYSNAQDVSSLFSKYPIGESAVQIYFPSKPDEVYIDYSPDSSVVYTVECTDASTGQDFQFGAIVVNLKDEVEEDEREELLTDYMDYLKVSFNIISETEYSKATALSTHESAIGVTDIWEDDEAERWEVTGWIAENTIVVLFEYGPDEYPNRKAIDFFMKGVRFFGD